MSGAYSDPKPLETKEKIMSKIFQATDSRNQQIEWQVFNKNAYGGASAYKASYDMLRVFVPKSSSKWLRFAVTPAVMEFLKSRYVLLLESGDFIGLQPSVQENVRSYKITINKNVKRGMGLIGCGIFLKQSIPKFPYTIYYDCLTEGEVLYFDKNGHHQM